MKVFTGSPAAWLSRSFDDGDGAGYMKNNYVRNVFGGKYLPNMNKFCDWLSETKVISFHDSFF